MNANIMQEEMMEALQVVNRTFDEADIQFAQIALGIADDASQGLFDGNNVNFDHATTSHHCHYY